MRPGTIQDWHLLRGWSSEWDFGWCMVMSVTDPVDTIHHEMDSVVCSHCVYKPVWSPVIGEQLGLEKEPVSQSTWWFCSTWQW